jgi:hypothetical protein
VRYLGGLVLVESEMDPGAVGYNTPNDKGLVQFNLKAHPEIGYDQAFDPGFSIPWAANELREIHDKYVSAKADPWMVAILWHNSPANAVALARTGQYPTNQAREYVQAVLAAW